jgi:hypothetical protein
MPKKTEYQKAKEELDRVFSLYIRAKFMEKCYTCGKRSSRLQCGHFISRQYLATRWDESNCRPQCWGCNGYGKGQPIKFEAELKRIYSPQKIEANKKKIWKPYKVDTPWLKEQIQKYKQLLAEIRKGNARVQ